MKKLLFAHFLICLCLSSFSQPNKNYIETKRDDGLLSRMYNPQIVCETKDLQIGLGLVTCQIGNYVYVILNLGQKQQMLKDKLALRLSNEELLRFEPESIRKTDLGKSKGVLGLYRLPTNHAEKLKRLKVTNISLIFDDGSLTTYTVNTNGDVFIKQFKQIQ